jgi:hypothetical protein
MFECLSLATIFQWPQKREESVKTRSGSGGWQAGMEARAVEREGRQIACLTSDAGHIWIHYYDALPARVRARLRESEHNICPACLVVEARKAAAARGLRAPTIAIFLAVLAGIERALR